MAFFGRGKNYISNPYTIKDIYNHYTTTIEKNSVYDVASSTHSSIINLFFKKVSIKLIDQADWFRLIHGLGTYQIVKKHSYAKTQGKEAPSIDWFNTLKYGKKIVHLNEHSDGKKFLFFWDRRTSRISNLSIYRFVPTRSNKRWLAKKIKVDKQDYFGYDTKKCQ